MGNTCNKDTSVNNNLKINIKNDPRILANQNKQNNNNHQKINPDKFVSLNKSDLIKKEINIDMLHDNWGQTFYKFVNDTFTHNNFTYKVGVNKDIMPFIPEYECHKGGLYFADKININNFSNYGNSIAVIKLLQDSRIYVENKKFKANKFYICCFINPSDINRVDSRNPTITDIKIYPYNLVYSKKSYDECMCAVSVIGLTLQYVPDIYKSNINICIAAVKQDGLALQFVQNKTDEIINIALKQNPKAIQFI
jgi:hypothetical protein